MNLKDLRKMGYTVGHDNNGGLRVYGPKPSEKLQKEMAQHKRDLLLELFGECLRRANPPFDADHLSDLELGQLGTALMGQTLEGFGLAVRARGNEQEMDDELYPQEPHISSL